MAVPALKIIFSIQKMKRSKEQMVDVHGMVLTFYNKQYLTFLKNDCS